MKMMKSSGCETLTAISDAGSLLNIQYAAYKSLVMKIISGGQTGTDRAALDSALQLGMPCGGYCPLGRRAEDGRISSRYPLTESLSNSYLVRTLQNLLCSDATVCFFHEQPEGGTAKTIAFCKLHDKPLLLIDSATTTPSQAAAQLFEFVSKHHTEVLNVAGPRRSKCQSIYSYTRTVLDHWGLLLKSG